MLRRTVSIIVLLMIAGWVSAQTLQRYEYWLDGQCANPAEVVSSEEEIIINIPLSEVSKGLHFLNFRAQNTEGVWGSCSRYLFFYPDVPSPDAVLTKYEYWIDNDWAGRVIRSASGGDIAETVDVSKIKTGLHFYNFRAQNSDGTWGPLNRFLFFLPDVPSPDAVLTKYEYWIDNDWAGREIRKATGDDIAETIDVSKIKTGLHFYNFRAQNSDGTWGSLARYLFFLPDVPSPDAILTQYEYWLDNDFADRQVVEDATGDYAVSIPLDGVPYGVHYFNFRAKNSDGTWGSLKRMLFYYPEGAGKGATSIVGYRYGFNEQSTFVTVEPTDELIFSAKIFNIPEPLYFASVADGVFTVEASGSVKMNRTSVVNFSLQFVNQGGIWSTPQCTSFQMTDSLTHSPVDLAVQKMVALDKVPSGDFQAVKMVISEQKKYYLKADQSCSIRLLKDGKVYIKEITPAQLLNTYSVNLAPGTYHAIVYNMVKNETYPQDKLTLRLMLTDNYVPTPEIAYSEGVVSITCAQEGASIYYTLDGTDPTKQSTLYTAPFALDHNATIKALATYEDLADSYVASYTVDSYNTEPPVVQFANLKVYMSCATGGAEIHYTLDGTVPDMKSTRYTEPFTQSESCTVKAIAQKSGYNASTVTVYELDVANVKCIAPAIEVQDNAWMTMSTLTEGATIYYTTDGSTPTKSSTKYTGTITLTKNATYRAIAVKNGLLDSPVTEYEVNWFKASLPAFSFSGGVLTISCTTPGAVIHYCIGGEVPTSSSAVYTAPITLTDNNVVKAMAVAAGFIDSDVATYYPNTFTCDTVSISYDGRAILLTTTTPDAVIHYTLDGTDPGESAPVYKEKFKLSGLCTVKAVATKQKMNNSAVTSYIVRAFYDGGTVSVGEAGTLSKAFEWCGTSSLQSLEIKGTVGASDLAFIRNVKSLQYLDLSSVRLTGDSLPSGCFKGMNLVSVSLPSQLSASGAGLFEGCTTLAAIEWNANIELGNGALDGFANPNLLLYVAMKSYAPAGIQNVVANGTAAQIVLTDVESGNNNFYCPKEFTATAISYTHSYTMKTVIGTTQGYETLSLPFDVKETAHQEKGAIAPFASYVAGSQKPFWLYSLTANGFEKASSIEANKPYILSMPNNDEYIDSYVLAGNVTFSATNATVHETGSLKSDNYTTFHFTPNYLGRSKAGVSALNVGEAYKGNPAGSVFVPGLRDVRPFEGYITSDAQGVFHITDAGFETAIDEIPAESAGFEVWTEGHCICIRSSRSENVEILSATGLRVRSVTLTEGVNTINDLPAGIYLVGGVKVSVR